MALAAYAELLKLSGQAAGFGAAAEKTSQQ